MRGKVGENPAALRAAVFSLSSKNLRGGVQTPPPPAGRGLIKAPLGTEFCRHCFDVFHLPVSAVVFKKNAKKLRKYSPSDTRRQRGA